MPYLWSFVAVVVALVGLGLVAATLLGPVRRLSTVAALLRQLLRREGGMLTARTAALRVRFDERRA